MKKLVVIFLMFAAFIQIRAVDYGALEVDVRSNPGDYKVLLDRFVAADTTLTSQEVAKVYYGFPFTPFYEPSDTFPDVHTAFKEKNYGEVARLAEEALQLNPVSLAMTMIALEAYQNDAGDHPGLNARKMAQRRDFLLSAIIDSGKGTDPSTPFYVISDDDRQTFLYNVLGIGDVIGTSPVGDSNVVAYRFVFKGLPRMHMLYFDLTPQKRFQSK